MHGAGASCKIRIQMHGRIMLKETALSEGVEGLMLVKLLLQQMEHLG